MLNRQVKASRRESTFDKAFVEDNTQNIAHDGFRTGFSSLLLGIPSESLLHITSYLDPPSLLTLGQVNRRLCDHVRDDNTWNCAFVLQYLGVVPESQIDEGKTLLIRHSDDTWRTKFIARYKLRRRWELSRNSPLTHTPLGSTEPNLVIHLISGRSPITTSMTMPTPTMLAFCNGSIARSLPLTGKILNTLVMPLLAIDPQPCALASEDGRGRVLYGYPDGTIGLIVVPKSGNRPVFCSEHDAHIGPVADLCWDNHGHLHAAEGHEYRGRKCGLAVSAGLDSKIKIWYVGENSIDCVWSSQVPLFESSSTSEPPRVVSSALFEHGVVFCALKNGDVVLWSGLQSVSQGFPLDLSGVKMLRIPSPARSNSQSTDIPQVSAVHIDPKHLPTLPTISSPVGRIHVLLAYLDHSRFYRLSVDLDSLTFSIAAFGGDPPSGSISVLVPYFSEPNDAETHKSRSFVIIGDVLGCISFYDWAAVGHDGDDTSTTNISQIIPPTLRFEAFDNASRITSIAWSELVLVVGSVSGDVKVWDGLSFELLQEFAPPSRQRSRRIRTYPTTGNQAEEVQQILIGNSSDFLVFTAGRRVVAWWAGSVRKKPKSLTRARKNAQKAVGKTASKALQTLDLQEAINESLDEVKAHSRTMSRLNARLREQTASLNRLGLNEGEAIEYALMLSQDDYDRRRAGEVPQSADGDLDVTYESEQPSLCNVWDPSLSPTDSQLLSIVDQHSQTSNSTSTYRLLTSVSPISDFDAHFPPANRSVPHSRQSSHSPPNQTGSYRDIVSAWTKTSGSSSTSTHSTRSTGAAPGRKEAEMDDDLRFAIEVSLAEARSREEAETTIS